MVSTTFTGNALVEKITYSRIFSSSWQSIYDTLNDALVNPTRSGRKWIYGAFPDASQDNEDYYPLIVIEPVSFQNGEPESFDRKTRVYSMNCEISVFATDAASLDSVSDSVVEELLRTSLDTLHSKFSNPDFSASTDAFKTQGGKRIHERTINMTFEYDLEV